MSISKESLLTASLQVGCFLVQASEKNLTKYALLSKNLFSLVWNNA